MLLAGLLDRTIKTGTLEVIVPGERARAFGPGGRPAVTVRLHDRALSRRLLLNPALFVGEAYMDGTLTLDEGTLTDFLHLCTYGADTPERHPLQRIVRWLWRPLRYAHQYNPARRARANAAHHYDLSDTLYDLFLDRDRQYSCAYFQHGDETLDEAQARKKSHIAAKLLLSRRTVAKNVYHILKKLDVHSRTDIAREAALRTIASR